MTTFLLKRTKLSRNIYLVNISLSIRLQEHFVAMGRGYEASAERSMDELVF